MMDFDDYYADCAYWCPLCGDPRSVCDAYGRCDQPSDEDWELDSPFYDESREEIYGDEE